MRRASLLAFLVMFTLLCGCVARPEQPAPLRDRVEAEGPAAPDRVLADRVDVEQDRIDGITWWFSDAIAMTTCVLSD
jgi:hypothetical protein